MSSVLVEIVVQTPEEAVWAETSGADRLEVCCALEEGGLTPSPGLLHEIRSATTLPLAVMIRPRSGGFVYSASEVRAMARDVEWVSASGVQALVFGALTPGGAIDEAACQDLRAGASDLPWVFHRAFDLAVDTPTALETLVSLGFRRVLTSGGMKTAREGVDGLRTLRALAQGRIEVLAGGGVRADNVREIVERSGVDQVHLAPLVARPSEGNSKGAYAVRSGYVVDSEQIRYVVMALSQESGK